MSRPRERAIPSEARRASMVRASPLNLQDAIRYGCEAIGTDARDCTEAFKSERVTRELGYV